MELRSPTRAAHRRSPSRRTHRRGRAIFLLVVACAALASTGRASGGPVPPKVGFPQGDSAAKIDHAALRRKVAAWPQAEQRRLLERWRFEVNEACPRTAELVRRARGLLGVDPGHLKEQRPPRWFDPKEHAPAQPIPRKVATSSDSAMRALEKRIEVRRPQRPERVRFHYDFGVGEVRRAPEKDDEQWMRLFDNALLGRHPDWDLAEAAVAASLDDGSQRAALEAFGHCYTTRDGKVYAGVTLLDAWSSGREIEMPDVDVLGIVHTVLGDRTTWVAPIKDTQHKALYARIGELFLPARRLASAVTNLSRAHAAAEPVFVDGYQSHQALVFHALWAAAGDDPGEARRLLPPFDDPEFETFAGQWQRRMGAEPELLEAARARQEELAREAAWMRDHLAALVAEHEPKDKKP
ncbi:MAG: hypothetical protein GC161_00890 [Planctomycetaceae bacterium]|nr:hypothetical protein [Planctomycetaceae bacterium]